jgi:hypothetical protein
VLAGQHAGTAGATDGVGYEAIGETYALVCDAVDVGGLDVSLVVVAFMPVVKALSIIFD